MVNPGPSNTPYIPAGLSRWLLGGWLIANGLVPLLGIGTPALVMLLSLVAIAAGILILLGR